MDVATDRIACDELPSAKRCKRNKKIRKVVRAAGYFDMIPADAIGMILDRVDALSLLELGKTCRWGWHATKPKAPVWVRRWKSWPVSSFPFLYGKIKPNPSRFKPLTRYAVSKIKRSAMEEKDFRHNVGFALPRWLLELKTPRTQVFAFLAYLHIRVEAVQYPTHPRVSYSYAIASGLTLARFTALSAVARVTIPIGNERVCMAWSTTEPKWLQQYI